MKTGKEKEKKLVSEEATFEIDVPDKYGTIEKLVASKDYLMMVCQMSRDERVRFFNGYGLCEKFEIVSHGCVGGRCFIEVEFWYEDHGNE